MKDAHQLNEKFWAMVRQMEAAREQEVAMGREQLRSTPLNNRDFDLMAVGSAKKVKDEK